MKRVPENGLPADTVMERLLAAKSKDLDWQSGRAMGFVYVPDPEIQALAKQAFMAFLTENALDQELLHKHWITAAVLVASSQRKHKHRISRRRRVTVAPGGKVRICTGCQ